MTPLTRDEHRLLQWLLRDDVQYGSCEIHLIDPLLDRGLVEWRPDTARLPEKDERWVSITDDGRTAFTANRLGSVLAESTFDISGLTLRCYVLDDGKRLIEAEGMARLFEAMIFNDLGVELGGLADWARGK